MGERRPGFRFLCALGPLLVAVAAGCKANDTTGPDDPQPGGAGGGANAGRGMGNAGSTPPRGGTGASAGRAGSTSGAAGTSGDSGSSAGQGGTDAPDGGAGSGGSTSSGPMAQDAECDMNGIWIARLTTFSRDSVFGAVQTASNWFYYELEQDGTEVAVKAEIDCGIQVSGSADVTLNRATTESLLVRNEQSSRRATFEKDGDGCGLRFDRFYSVRGVPRETYLPADLSSEPELSAITPALPSEAMPAGSEDWDGDGTPGIAYQVANLGTRHVAQRDWNEFFSSDDYAIALDSEEFVAAANFDSTESLLGTSGLGPLLQAGATPMVGAKHRITFRRLGSSASDPAVMAVRVDSAIDTCYNVQDALPHLTTDM